MSLLQHDNVRLALPKGRMQQGVLSLLSEAGIKVGGAERAYRPSISLANFEVKILKPQNIIEMLHFGSRDIGFAGADWVEEFDANLVELLDTGLDPVRLIAAAPPNMLAEDELINGPLTIASEYQKLTKRWIEQKNLDAKLVRSYGATEVFPPEDADCIVDNTATGSTLKANNLVIFDELMRSSTRLYANPAAVAPGSKHKQAIDEFVMLVRSVIEARSRVMLDINVARELLETVLEALPAMKKPTVSELSANEGYAIKTAVKRSELPVLIPKLKSAGACDIVVTAPTQIVP